MLNEQRKFDYARENNVPGINFRNKEGNLVWRKLDAELKADLKRQGYNWRELEKSYLRRRGQKQVEKDVDDVAAAKAAAEEQKPEQPKEQPKEQKPKQLTNREKWEKANPRLAAAEKIRAEFKSAGKSPYSKEARKAVSKVIYTDPKSKAYVKDSYDVVLDYLFSMGHVDTLEEAHYIMMQLDSENIQGIMEQMLPPIDFEKHKAAQKTQKIYNKATQGAGSEKDFLKRTGAQLPRV